MANLAVRHVDTELAEATKHAYQQATWEVGEGRISQMLRPWSAWKLQGDLCVMIFPHRLLTLKDRLKGGWCAVVLFWISLWTSVCLKDVFVAVSTLEVDFCGFQVSDLLLKDPCYVHLTSRTVGDDLRSNRSVHRTGASKLFSHSST